jgi:hypothetical protein
MKIPHRQVGGEQGAGHKVEETAYTVDSEDERNAAAERW